MSPPARRGADSSSTTRIGRYLAGWHRENSNWSLASLAVTGLPPVRVPDAMPLRLSPLAAAGPAREFIAADLAFARLAADSGAALAFERWAAPAGDFGFTVGEATITPSAGEAAHSKYLAVWRRRPDGTIRFIADGGNPRPPTP